jgi:hypothetical protein
MGYNTDFRGELKFTPELTARQLAYINRILGEDCRDHPEWTLASPDLTYIELELLEDFSGIQWTGTENTYNMDKCVETVIGLMQENWPEFGLKGKLLAQGEDIEDRYEIHVNGDNVVTKNVMVDGAIIECPHCGQEFEYNKD